MNLYKISQTVNRDYDTYDSAVVAAVSMDKARLVHPQEGYCAFGKPWDGKYDGCWCDASDVKVELIGVAKAGTKSGVICASFNAG